MSEIEQNAEKEAERQYAERQVEKFGRLAMYSLDSVNRREYRKKEEEWNKKLGKSSMELLKMFHFLL